MASQMMIVRSSLAEVTRFPSGLKATAVAGIAAARGLTDHAVRACDRPDCQEVRACSRPDCQEVRACSRLRFAWAVETEFPRP